MDTLLNPYLTFSGNCRQAMEFYHEILGGKLEMQTFGELMPGPEEINNNIMHARLVNDRIVLMASDNAPGSNLTVGDNVSLSVSGSDEDGLTKIFNGLAEGGSITMPLEPQVWGDVFGMCTDKFGMHWMVNINQGK